MPSTVIRSYNYNARRRELDIVFQTRRRYRYRHVPLATYAALKAAASKGEFFNHHIRGRFEFSRDPLGESGGNPAQPAALHPAGQPRHEEPHGRHRHR
jgi:hypothetical protein